jgi:hypothetical protein
VFEIVISFRNNQTGDFRLMKRIPLGMIASSSV